MATTVGGHLAAGRGHLVTRDTVRLATVLALQAVGVVPSRLTLDLPRPGVQGVVPLADLLLDGPGGTVLDLRLPWDAEPGRNTHTMGVLVRDLLRISTVPARQRWLVQVLATERMGHLASAAVRRGLPWPDRPGTRMLLDRQALDDLPPGAAAELAGGRWQLPVVVACAGVWPVSDDLGLHAYEVSVPLTGPKAAWAPREEPPRSSAGPGGVVLEPVPIPEQVLERARPVAPPSPRGTARAEVLEAVRALVTRQGHDVVHVADVLAHVRSSGSRFAEATVRTMLTQHMCAQVQGRGVASYDDLDQVDEQRYRLRPGR
ncbi:hypothetical protein [Nocardioides solisilvae]|uniref:hypothetical protein n=1 Tax=Nocardioides solisilvae TaxID=1542435 RepID=UPI0013A58A55|nr:hypothetical protein [Nocardioides solisilvae]